MSESTTIMKVVSFFGICALFISLLVTDGRLPSEILAWNTLTSTVTAGIKFPAFDNPFQEEFLFATVRPIADGFPEPGNIVGCSNPGFWECLKSNDGDTSYWTLNNTLPDGTVKTGVLGGTETITRIVINTDCRSTGTTAQPFRFVVATTTSAQFLDSYVTHSANQMIFCPASSTYTRMSFTLPATNPLTNLPWEWSLIKTNWQIGPVSPAGTALRFTYIEALIYASTVPKCTAASWWDDQACQIGRFVNTIITGFQFIFNAISFVILSIVATLVFMVQVVFAIFTGMIGTAQFFLAFPGAPVPVQAFIASVFIGFIVFVIYLTAKLIRGGGP